MTAIVDSFFPLLALILLGWFLRRRELLGATSARELTAFVVRLALPALLFAVGIVLLELGAGSAARPLASMGKAARAVARNPLVVAVVMGGLWSASGGTMPQAPHRLLELLSGAAGPCALVSIGALLAQPVPPGRARISLLPVVVAKLLVRPAICALLAIKVFALPPAGAVTAVLLNALPTGTGPFMLAEFHGRDVARASRIMFVTTMLSLVTVPICIALLR